MANEETKVKVKTDDDKPDEAPKEPSSEEQTTENKPPESVDSATEETTEDSEPKEAEDSDAPEETPQEEGLEKSEEIIPELSNQYKLPTNGEVQAIHHKSFKRVLIGIAVVIALSILAAGAIWMTHDSPVSEKDSQIVYSQGAAITAVEGEVEYNSGSGWNEVTSGTNLKEGDSLRTMDGSRAVISLDEGSAIRLDNNTVVTLTKLTFDEVTVTNAEGQVYARVVPSETRVFVVTVGEQEYQSVGTAYITVNEENEKGVKVFHSKVDVVDKAEVGEGESYYTDSKDEAKKEKVAKLSIEELEKDDFVNWNKTKDEDGFADKLGILKELGKAKEEEKEEPAPAPVPGVPAGITLSGTKGAKGVDLSWSVNGINTADGFKVVYDKSDTTPSYGENSSQYVGSKDRATTVKLTDGKVWNIRVCAYRPGTNSCDSYSNLVQITAPKVDQPAVKTGTVSLQITGNVLGWSLTGGSAPYGFKVVYNTTGNPNYPGDNPTYVNGQVYEIKTDKLTPGTYYFRVCKYNENLESNPSKCLDYSNEVQYTKT